MDVLSNKWSLVLVNIKTLFIKPLPAVIVMTVWWWQVVRLSLAEMWSSSPWWEYKQSKILPHKFLWWRPGRHWTHLWSGLYPFHHPVLSSWTSRASPETRYYCILYKQNVTLSIYIISFSNCFMPKCIEIWMT